MRTHIAESFQLLRNCMFYMAVKADVKVTSRNEGEIFQSNYDLHAPLRRRVFQACGYHAHRRARVHSSIKFL